MMNKAYLVIGMSGEYEDYTEIVYKGFKDIKKAEEYKAHLEEQEESRRSMVEKCSKCGGFDKDCPFYVAPYNLDEECENYEPYYESEDFRIDEIEFEE